MGRLQEEDLNRLRALDSRPSASSLIQTSNLELRRPLIPSSGTSSQPKLRTSSPLSQQQLGPAKWGASPIANGGGGQSYSDVSTVSHRSVFPGQRNTLCGSLLTFWALGTRTYLIH